MQVLYQQELKDNSDFYQKQVALDYNHSSYVKLLQPMLLLHQLGNY